MVDEKEMMKRIERMKKEGKLPSMEEFLRAVAEARVMFQQQIIEGRERALMAEQTEDDEQ